MEASVNFQVRTDVKYFSLHQHEYVQSWRSKWFYGGDESTGVDPDLPTFTINDSVKKTVVWKHEMTTA